MATPRRRAFLFVLLALAVTGPAALLAGRGAAGAPAVVAHVGAVDPGRHGPSPVAVAPSTARAPLVVVAPRSSLATYLDLAIRVAALVLAWHLQRAENGPPPRGRTVVGRRRS